MFGHELLRKINKSLRNNYKEENHWHEKYGSFYKDEGTYQRSIKEVIKPFIKPILNLRTKYTANAN